MNDYATLVLFVNTKTGRPDFLVFPGHLTDAEVRPMASAVFNRLRQDAEVWDNIDVKRVARIDFFGPTNV